MIDETPTGKIPPPSGSTPSPSSSPQINTQKTTITNDEPPPSATTTSQFRRRSTNRLATLSLDGLQSSSPKDNRRRSSNFSEYSLNELRNSFRDSTDDILFPKPSDMVSPPSHESSHWDSAPLAFALLPALGGLFFTNGSSVITDVMLLGFAAILLNWSVRIPWDWYHSAQSIRKSEEYNEDFTGEVESEDDAALESPRGSLDEKNEDKQAPQSQKKSSTSRSSRRPAHETATKELYAHEILALISCFVFPLAGAYILHSIRSQLSRPSEGLVSNYNLTIFLLASELRPMAHLVRLVMARTLHLQRIVNSNPYYDKNTKIAEDTQDLVRRLEDLESRALKAESTKGPSSEPVLTGKQSAILISDIRRTLQPDLDALNRAVRRYEKRATLQSFQTESRLLDLEARLNDAISLAAAAANNSQKRSVPGIAFEWLSSAVVLPFHAVRAVMSLPFKTMLGVVKYSQMIAGGQESSDKPKKISNARYVPHTRLGDRVQGRAKR